jgi:Rap1a immunity proteins
MKTFSVAIFLLLTGFGAKAQNESELSQQCLTNSKASIVGYVEGVLDKAHVDSEVLFHFYFDTYDVHKTIDSIEKDNQALVRSFLTVDGYCLPKDVTFEQKADVFCKYLLDHPDQRSKNAAELLGSALKNAWPCN